MTRTTLSICTVLAARLFFLYTACMLGLHYKTPASWAQQALAQPGELLKDHYCCELKAAAMAQRNIKVHGQKYPKIKSLMVELAAEEMEHAEQCQQLLKEMNLESRHIPTNQYARGLRTLAHNTGHGSFMDMLLVCSLIEARSAERFRLLADAANGTTMGNFYADLYASEVGHYVLFVKLSAEQFGTETTLKRLEYLRKGEAEIIKELPHGPRIH